MSPLLCSGSSSGSGSILTLDGDVLDSPIAAVMTSFRKKLRKNLSYVFNKRIQSHILVDVSSR